MFYHKVCQTTIAFDHKRYFDQTIYPCIHSCLRIPVVPLNPCSESINTALCGNRRNFHRLKAHDSICWSFGNLSVQLPFTYWQIDTNGSIRVTGNSLGTWVSQLQHFNGWRLFILYQLCWHNRHFRHTDLILTWWRWFNRWRYLLFFLIHRRRFGQCHLMLNKYIFNSFFGRKTQPFGDTWSNQQEEESRSGENQTNIGCLRAEFSKNISTIVLIPSFEDYLHPLLFKNI